MCQPPHLSLPCRWFLLCSISRFKLFRSLTNKIVLHFWYILLHDNIFATRKHIELHFLPTSSDTYTKPKLCQNPATHLRRFSQFWFLWLACSKWRLQGTPWPPLAEQQPEQQHLVEEAQQPTHLGHAAGHCLPSTWKYKQRGLEGMGPYRQLTYRRPPLRY